VRVEVDADRSQMVTNSSTSQLKSFSSMQLRYQSRALSLAARSLASCASLSSSKWLSALMPTMSASSVSRLHRKTRTLPAHEQASTSIPDLLSPSRVASPRRPCSDP
jgi:hypothetical protein